ncbi:MAG: histidine--tRNA ligase [Bacilli bacterium]
MSYQRVKGTQDFYNDSILKLRYVEKLTLEIAKNYGFKEIKTPIFENTEVFTRLGDESDVVKKEMYTFMDKGNRSITLRPEGTAGVVRSFIENKLYANNLPLNKLCYFGPMFRYERPQAGRFREFNQFGVEVFGAGTPLLDADVIISAYNIFKSLGIENIKLKINSIGDFESRQNYSKALEKYFASNIENMCSDCNRRLVTNPMRILDCKVDKNNPILLNAPNINEYLNQDSIKYFNEVLSVLDAFNINYDVDYNLVRGLDYYTDTVFEYVIESDDELNSLAICAGGKYSSLVKEMSNQDIPGIGYAFGVERIIAIMEKQNKFKDIEYTTDVQIISLDEISKLYSLKLANELRLSGYVAEIDYTNITMKHQFKLADKINPKFIIIVGEDEIKNNKFTIKNSYNKEQVTINSQDLLTFLKENL